MSPMCADHYIIRLLFSKGRFLRKDRLTLLSQNYIDSKIGCTEAQIIYQTKCIYSSMYSCG